MVFRKSLNYISKKKNRQKFCHEFCLIFFFYYENSSERHEEIFAGVAKFPPAFSSKSVPTNSLENLSGVSSEFRHSFRSVFQILQLHFFTEISSKQMLVGFAEVYSDIPQKALLSGQFEFFKFCLKIIQSFIMKMISSYDFKIIQTPQNYQSFNEFSQ